MTEAGNNLVSNFTRFLTSQKKRKQIVSVAEQDDKTKDNE